MRNSEVRRTVAAFAAAIGLHELLAMLVPAPVPPASSQREIVARVTVARIATLPSPSPTPRPRAVTRAHPVAPVEAKVAPPARTAASTRAGTIARSRAARPKPPATHATPIWRVPAGAPGAGAGNPAGTGSGGGNAGGSGNAGGGEPCGSVEFSDPRGSRYDPHTHGFFVDVQMSVRFPDGRSDSVLLDYPWYYRSDASNPWSDRNLSDPNFPTTFQFPPPEKRANEPPLVQYVIAHTSPDGYTLLKTCPPPAPR